jgi:hypothetical protein
MTNDHTSPVEESAGLTLSPLELMLLADAANLQAQPIGIQMADGICKALFSPRVSRLMPARLIEACAGYRCAACGRPEFDCSLNPCPAVIADREEWPETPQHAVVVLQHIINRTHDQDTIFTAACAIAEIATEAALNGTIVDPLMGSDFEDASPAVAEEAANVMGQLASIFPKTVDPNSIEGFDYKHQAWVVRGRYQRCGHPALMACGCYGRRHQGERPACDAEIH